MKTFCDYIVQMLILNTKTTLNLDPYKDTSCESVKK